MINWLVCIYNGVNYLNFMTGDLDHFWHLGFPKKPQVICFLAPRLRAAEKMAEKVRMNSYLTMQKNLNKRKAGDVGIGR